MDKRELSKKISFIDSYKNAVNASTGSAYDSNANVTQKNLATMQCEIGKKDIIDVNRELMRSYIAKRYGEEVGNQYLEDLKHHTIYRNDETSIMPYCCSISLYPFLLHGLTELGGSSKAPTHANSYIGGIINLVFMISSQFAGAVSLPEFLCYFDHFLRIDYGEDYINNLDEVVEKTNAKEFTLRHKIEDWFQQFIYSINQPAGARNYQSPFINIAYFDKYYFESIFEDFIFPDGDEPKWESLKELQKLFMRWFNKERERSVLTFPVESFSLLVDKDTQQYKDEESAQFVSEMWAEGHSFFCYQSDSADALSSCCRLRNAIVDRTFSYTLGCGSIETGSKCVITLNINRIVQDWDRDGRPCELAERIDEIGTRVHKYLNGWNDKLWEDYEAGMLPVYKAGFIDLDKQYLTVGINSFLEGAEFLGIDINPDNDEYKKYSHDILGTLSRINKRDKTDHTMYNTEMIPAENAGKKLYDWDKKDGYVVPDCRNLYNSYFYKVEDTATSPVEKFFFQGTGFASECDGGVALHNNLDEHLTKEQYRKLLDVAVKAGCNYFTYNVRMWACENDDCGYVSKVQTHDHKCPKCGGDTVPVTRIIGYLKKVSDFSAARQEEFGKRYFAKDTE